MASSDDFDAEYDRIMEEFDTILHLMGQIVAAWASLDEALMQLLATLAGCEPKAAGVIYYALDAFSTRHSVATLLAS
jgi:hypothetical protein